MIIENLSKIKIHFLYYIVAFISIITGYFKNFLIFSILILIHEIGHIVVALFYKWKIEKIIFLPFGGLILFKEHLNKPLKEEFFILIFGPIFQIIFFIIAFNIYNSHLLFSYNYFILIFNLLPIYPLDGSKLLNIILNKFLPFKLSYTIMLITSMIAIFLIFNFVKDNFLLLIIFIFLLIQIILEYQKISLIFHKFLFERFIYNFSFKKQKIVKSCKLTKMQKDYKHLFYVENRYITEKEILSEKFKK